MPPRFRGVVVTFGTAPAAAEGVAFTAMEAIFLLWDDLDDFAHAARHLVASAFSDLVELSRSL